MNEKLVIYDLIFFALGFFVGFVLCAIFASERIARLERKIQKIKNKMENKNVKKDFETFN